MKKFVINEHINWDAIGAKEDDDVILTNNENGSIMIINQTAFYILEKIIQNFSMDEIIKQASSEYGIDIAHIKSDIFEIIDLFILNNIIIESQNDI